jgi:hypothetical protein
MTYVLNDTAALRSSESAKSDVKSSGPTFWQRFYAALIESRRQSAVRELRARSYLVNEAEIVLGGFPQTALKDDAALPFNR